jgi:hypothetical protein
VVPDSGYGDKLVLPQLSYFRVDNDSPARLAFMEDFVQNIGTVLPLWSSRSLPAVAAARAPNHTAGSGRDPFALKVSFLLLPAIACQVLKGGEGLDGKRRAGMVMVSGEDDCCVMKADTETRTMNASPSSGC